MKTLRYGAIGAAITFLLLFASTVYSQNSQSYLNDTGSTAYGINIPVENGYINISNGNLHLEFPLASHPQRGALSLNERLVYDSRIWNFLPFGTHGSYHWWPYNIYGASQTSGGWRFISGNEVGAVSYSSLSYSTYDCDGNGTNSWNENSSINWTDPGGTLHTFYASLSAVDDACANQYTQTINPGSASDGSGYTIHDDGNGNPVVVDNNGTQVYPQVIDRYGNYWSADGQGNLIDDTGRVPVVATQNGNTTYYDVLAPNGTPQNDGTKRIRYTVTIGQVYVSTQFLPYDQSDIYPFTSPGVISPVQSITLPDGVSKYSFTYDSYGELTQITLPTGGTIQYGYENFLDSSQTENRWLTSRQTNNDASTVTTYKPKTITQCSNYSTGCQERIALITPDQNETLYTLTLNNGAWNTATTSYQGILGANHPLVQTTNDNIYTNSCSNALQCAGANFLSQSFTTTTIYAALQSQGPVSLQSLTSYNPANGKISDVLEGQNLVRSFSPAVPQGALRETKYTYAGNDLTQVSVYDSNGQLAGQTNYVYTSNAQPTPGLPQHGTTNAGGPYLSSESHWLSGGTSPITNYALDDTGQMVSVIDPAGHPKSTITYQCAGSLPLSVSNPLSQSTQYGYDCGSGALLSVQGPNDLAAQPARAGTTYQYEPVMGRVQSISYPDGGSTTYSYPTIAEMDTTVAAAPSPSITSSSITDNLGRPYRAIAGGAEVDTSYDSNGRLSCTTLPFSVGTTAAGSTCVTQYDGLNRPLSESQADATSRSWSYSANTVSATDESGNTTTYTKDILGNLTTVLEPTGYLTTYSYTGLGKISAITQLGNQSPLGRLPVSPHYSSPFPTDAPRIRSFTYDSLARPISESQPESGTICYGLVGSGGCVEDYDPNGNLRHKTDARGVVTSYVYDALNRLTSKTYSDGTAGANFNYDETGAWGAAGCGGTGFVQCNTIGRLTSMGTNDGLSGSVFGYDPMGRLTMKSNCLASLCGRDRIDQYFSYDLAGDPTSNDFGTRASQLATPFGGLGYTYDNAGRLQTVNGNQANTAPTNFFTATSYGPAGLLTSTLGNGLNEIRTYDNRQRQQSYLVVDAVPPSQTTFAGSVDSYYNSDLTRFPGVTINATGVPQNGQLTVLGWAGSTVSCPVAAVEVDLDQTSIGYATLGMIRSDVQQIVYANDGQHGACGYSFTGSIGNVAAGSHALTVYAIDAQGNRVRVPSNGALAIQVSTNAPPTATLDGITNTPIVSGGLLTMRGWAFDSEMRAPVGAVKVLIDGTPIGYATLGGSRPDVAAAYNDQRLTNSGWNFAGSAGNLAPGQHAVSVVVYDSGGQSVPIGGVPPITIIADTVNVAGYVDVIQGTSGTNNVPINGSVTVYGWAGEPLSPNCATSISRVDVLVDGNYMGQAQLGATRTDVANVVGNPSCATSGWGFTGTMGNVDPGDHVIEARAYDESGGSVMLYPKTVQVSAQLSPTSSGSSQPTQYAWSLGFEPNGNVGYAYDSVNGNNAYLYDNLNRLVAASWGAGNAYQWSYDSFGNRLSQTVTAGMGVSRSDSFSGGNNRPDGVPFDAAGNMLNDGTQIGVLGYDGESRLASSEATSYLYDAAGQRVAKYNSGVLTNAYLYDASGHRVTELDGAFAVLRREAYAGGRHLGTYDAANNFTYAMADWLGTERARANNNGVICQTSASQPFGAEQQVSGNCSPSTNFYTGLERDTESGLDHATFRQYASNMGRWTSPDPYNGSIDLTNPQSLNRYAYVNNMPLNFTDPSGMAPGNPGVCGIGEGQDGDLTVKSYAGLFECIGSLGLIS